MLLRITVCWNTKSGSDKICSTSNAATALRVVVMLGSSASSSSLLVWLFLVLFVWLFVTSWKSSATHSRADTVQPGSSVSVRCYALPHVRLSVFVIKQQFSNWDRMNFFVKLANSLQGSSLQWNSQYIGNIGIQPGLMICFVVEAIS